MADFIESDEESENFEGFNDDDVNGYESESDISISSVGSENISDVENLLAKMKPKKQIFYSVFKFTTVECPIFHLVFPLMPNQSALDIFNFQKLGVFLISLASYYLTRTLVGFTRG